MTNQEATEKIQNIIQQLRDFVEPLEDMKRIMDGGRKVNQEYYQNVLNNNLRQLSYTVGTFNESIKPTKESHKQLRKELEKKAENIIKSAQLSDYLLGVSVSFEGSIPIDSDYLEIRVTMECSINSELLQEFNNAFKGNHSLFVEGHEYGKIPETVFNTGWLVDVIIHMSKSDFEGL